MPRKRSTGSARHETRVASAHRTPERVQQYAGTAQSRV